MFNDLRPIPFLDFSRHYIEFVPHIKLNPTEIFPNLNRGSDKYRSLEQVVTLRLPTPHYNTQRAQQLKTLYDAGSITDPELDKALEAAVLRTAYQDAAELTKLRVSTQPRPSRLFGLIKAQEQKTLGDLPGRGYPDHLDGSESMLAYALMQGYAFNAGQGFKAIKIPSRQDLVVENAGFEFDHDQTQLMYCEEFSRPNLIDEQKARLLHPKKPIVLNYVDGKPSRPNNRQ